jgi:hypothetical protein
VKVLLLAHLLLQNKRPKISVPKCTIIDEMLS